MDRKATAVWSGTLKEGSGTLSTQSGALADQPYSFRKRFEDEPGTNPEELIGAAHAGCFSMALSAMLVERGMAPERIQTTATVTLESVEGKPTVTKSHLEVSARVPGANPTEFYEVAQAAKAGCPISRLLTADITMNATLEN